MPVYQPATQKPQSFREYLERKIEFWETMAAHEEAAAARSRKAAAEAREKLAAIDAKEPRQ